MPRVASRENLIKTDKALSLLWSNLLAITLFAVFIVVFIGVSATSVHAAQNGGGGAGSGGNGTAYTGPGPSTIYGHGWAIFPVNVNDVNGGPSNWKPFNNGTSWSTVVSTCGRFGATVVYIYVISDSRGGTRGYNYPSYRSTPGLPFRVGDVRDGGSVINVTDASTAFGNLKRDFSKQVTGLYFGTNVSWFCYNPAVNNKPQGTHKYAADFNITGSSTMINGCYGVSPGATFRLNSTVRNVGTATSPPFYHRITTTGGANYITYVRSYGNVGARGFWSPPTWNPSLQAGTSSYPSKYIDFRLNANAPAGAIVTFEAAFNSYPTTQTGYASPRTLCVTPIVPSSIDVCPNIPGNQLSVPSTMIIDGSGNCVTPTQSIDVCPNIPGNQLSVPSTMFIDGSGNCVTPPPSVCSNIPNQASVPSGSILIGGACIVAQQPTCSIIPVSVVEINTQFNTSITINNPNGLAITINSSSWSTSPAGISPSGGSGGGGVVPGGGSLNISTQSLTAVRSGRYDITWNISGSVVSDPTAGTTVSLSCSATTIGTNNQIQAVTRPYARFYGNDVFAGGGYGDTCSVGTATVNMNGKFTGALNHSSYKGGAAELAVFAAGQISGVIPGSQDTSRSPIEELSFANSDSPLPNGSTTPPIFGGGFGGRLCAPDFPDTTGFDTLPTSAVASWDGEYVKDGNLVINNGNVPNKKRSLVVVNGDVTITGDIKYSSTLWASVSDISLFRIYATGDIYIDGSVSQLDGLYSAKGTIYTCTNGNHPYNASASEDAAILTNCGRQLVVNGAFVAQHVRLLRTLGTVSAGGVAEGSNSSNIAEVFNFSPEMYLGMQDEALKDTSNLKYDSILSLPPAF